MRLNPVPRIGVYASYFLGTRGIATVNSELFVRLIQKGAVSFVIFGTTHELERFKIKFGRYTHHCSFRTYQEIFRSELLRFLYMSFVLHTDHSRFVDGVWHAKNYGCYALPFVTKPALVTVHDIMGVARPELQGGKTTLLRSIKRHIRARTIKRAAIIVAVSAFTANELVRVLQVSPEKIVVVGNGVDYNYFKPLSRKQRVTARINHTLPAKYIFYAGAFNDYKNISATLRAFAQSKLPDNGYQYLLIGPQADTKACIVNKLRQEIAELSIAQHAAILPPAKESKDIAPYYQLASATICPSLYEGFGLSVIEAMACGSRIIASDIPPHQELLAGPNSTLVKPTDHRAWIDALNNLIATPKVTRHSRAHHWDKIATHYADLFHHLAILGETCADYAEPDAITAL